MTMTQPDPANQAYIQMQSRLIVLLLRHDTGRFRHYIATHSDYAAQTDEDGMRRYRELAVLFSLRDELFEHILPRIVRRLSFESPRTLTLEEPPPRGRVDWERTLAATWEEYPDGTPLEVYTRQRRRDFATPENLLTVATLLEYRADGQHLLWDETIASGESALRHPLNAIVEQCDRELVFPQFAALRTAAQQVLEGSDGGPAALEEDVRERLLPGGNNAYEELLAWREQRRSLRLLQRTPHPEPPPVLGADPRRDNYLYQLWIFYELLDLLEAQGRLEDADLTPGQMALRFTWGDGAARCRYELRHDQAVPEPVARWVSRPQSGDVPGVRPDFYLWRTDPPPQHVTHGGTRYWREPGIVWDAKYYRERESPRTPASPIKRMIADLTLLGEREGALLFAFLTAPTSREQGSGILQGSGVGGQGSDRRSAGCPAWGHPDPRSLTPDPYISPDPRPLTPELTPDPTHDQTIVPNQHITIHHIPPSEETIAAQLSRLLDDAHAHLHDPLVPACHGRFLEPLSVGKPTPLHDRHGQVIDSPSDDMLLCPKPHIGPWRVDLVSRRHHCGQDARLCHIIGQSVVEIPLRPPRTADDLFSELQHVFAQTPPGHLDDAAISRVEQRVKELSRQFAKLVGADQRFERYYRRLRQMGLRHTLDLLATPEQESLALALFLVEQLEEIAAEDYSAPAIHLSSVMEIENKRRVFAGVKLVGHGSSPKQQTLGLLPGMRRYIKQNNPDAIENWSRVTAHAEEHWRGTVDPDDPAYRPLFEDYVKQLDRIAQLRNKAAHTEPLSYQEYEELVELMFERGKRLRFGALNTLLLVWVRE